MARLEQCQQEAEEVVAIMKENFNKALEREGKLSDLDDRAEELRSMGQTFTRTSRAVAQKQRAGQRRWCLVLVGLAVGLAIIILIVVLALWLGGTRATPPVPPTVTRAAPGGD
ncbi:vesicle-associated membrane protein 5 isoform X2 [Struthio camelus]|uniref:vesicle-associated membrane protein 5 isoform X2 n=1 Tax=Struthio camelus TaxID=8801 RepID=UPI003603F13D